MLTKQASRESVAELLELLADPDPFVRWEAASGVAQIAVRLRSRAHRGMALWQSHSSQLTFSSLLAQLHQCSQSQDATARSAAADALGLVRHQAVVALLVPLLKDPEPGVRSSAALALGRVSDKEAYDALVEALDDPSVWVQAEAAKSLGAIGSPRAVAHLQPLLASPVEMVRVSAVTALGHLDAARARRLLGEYSRDSSAAVRWHVARGLGAVGNASSLSALHALLDDHDEFYGRSTAEVAAESITVIEHRQHGIISRLRRMWAWLSRLVRRRPHAGRADGVAHPQEAPADEHTTPGSADPD